MAIDEPQALEREDAGAGVEPELARRVPVGPGGVGGQEARGDVLADGGEIAREGAEVEDVVVDGRRGNEGAEAMTARDQAVALEHLERLAEGHERDTEALSEAALVVEALTRRDGAGADPVTEGIRDLMVAGHSAL